MESTKSYQLLNEKLMTTFIGFAMFKGSFLFPLLNDVVEKIIPAGIPQFLKKFHVCMRCLRKPPEDPSGPSVLSMDDLEFGFIICLVASAISSIFFVIEFLIWPRENKKRRKNEIKKGKCAKIHPIDLETTPSEILSCAKNYQEIYKKFRIKSRS